MSLASDLLKGLTATSGCWPLRARARRLPNNDQQGQAGSDRGAAIAARSGGNSGRSMV